jgi:hypothetical protein
MEENKIELKSINELQEMKFFIPSYQRGYRWTEQQVKDLLDDINEFIDNNSQGGFYCIQPLVVRKSLFQSDEENFKKELDELKSDSNLLLATEKLLANYTKWEVIDGQQRLTTIYILLTYLELANTYQIEYETRETSKEFLSNIDDNKKDENIDYYHMIVAKTTIESWFSDRDEGFKKKFLNTLLQNVKFIWYESAKEDSIKVFTRLNIGKISLTNAELIKALFLNRSNFQGSNQRVRLQQQEIASEWDSIEYTLQNDEFWLFLNKYGYDKPTRIDFIFDLMCEKDTLNLKELLKLSEEDYKKDLGTDDYKTFRYFYFWFKQQQKNKKAINESVQQKQPIVDCWKETKTIFHTFQEWFNDLELYHYVGFLIEQGTNIPDIFDNWKKENQSKKQFRNNYLTPQINAKISNVKDSNIEELIKGKDDKSKIRPILLLHNIQTIICQNSNLKNDEKYKLPVFYKFPFHLFKKENWDVEHIDSNNENSLEDLQQQKVWLKNSLIAVNKKDLEKQIKEYIKQGENNESQQDLQPSTLTFDNLRKQILAENNQSDSKLSQEDKQKIWNLCLLDSSTNRGYGNDIFPVKRRKIIGKDQGKYIDVDDNLEVQERYGAIAFIPLCTKNAFLKYYNPTTNNLREWDKEDAQTYLTNIKEVLKDFLSEGTKQ